MLQLECHIFLGAQVRINGNLESSMTDENVNALVMDLYRKRGGKKEKNNIYRNAPPFKYIAAAEYLTIEPTSRGSGQVGKDHTSVQTSPYFVGDDERHESG